MRLSPALCALLIAGCSWSDVLREESKSLPPGASFGYAQGHSAGCKSAIARHGKLGFDKPKFTRDEPRIESEPEYRNGWERGYEDCSGKYARYAPYYPLAGK